MEVMDFRPKAGFSKICHVHGGAGEKFLKQRRIQPKYERIRWETR
jgi:hypothetical protein